MAVDPMQPTPNLAARVAAQIEHQVIRQLLPGDRLPALRVLAGELAVSVSTLQSALAVLRQRGLVESRQGSGVYVAEPRRQRIGILSELDLLDSRHSAYFRAVATALNQEFREMGMDPRLYVGTAEPGKGLKEPTCPAFWEDVAGGQLHGGVILNTPWVAGWRERLDQCPIPLVGWRTGYEAEIDFLGVTRAAVRRLATAGCRRLGILAWGLEHAFHTAIREAGLETREAWIRCDIDPGIRGAGWDEFREIWLASPDRPDGLLFLDDTLFADAQLAMLELHVRIPEQLQLAVLTCREVAVPVRVPITRFEIDAQEIAAYLAAMLQAQMSGGSPAAATRLVAFREIDSTVPQPT